MCKALGPQSGFESLICNFKLLSMFGFLHIKNRIYKKIQPINLFGELNIFFKLCEVLRLLPKYLLFYTFKFHFP